MLGYIILTVCIGIKPLNNFFQGKEISVYHFFVKIYFYHVLKIKVLQIVIFSHNTKLILLPDFRETNILQNENKL